MDVSAYSLVSEITMIVAQHGLELYKQQLRRRPALILSLTAVCVIILSISVIFITRSAQQRLQALEEQRLATLDLQGQVDQLNEVEKELNGLLQFVRDQRTVIANTQETIAELQSEKAALEPLVEADRETVEALLRVQEEAAARNRWKDIGIGFITGFFTEIVVAVALAPLLVPRLQRTLSRLRNSAESGEE